MIWLVIYVVIAAASLAWTVPFFVKRNRNHNAVRVADGRRPLPLGFWFMSEVVVFWGVVWPVAWAFLVFDRIDDKWFAAKRYAKEEARWQRFESMTPDEHKAYDARRYRWSKWSRRIVVPAILVFAVCCLITVVQGACMLIDHQADGVVTIVVGALPLVIVAWGYMIERER